MVTVTSARTKTKAKRIAATATTTPTPTTTTTTTTTTTMSHTVLQVLAVSVLLLLAQRPPTARALPITSKPIEGTAEHLAWQAWLMLPPEQKELEKSRKVTPKSIFTLPFRDCPPGHQLFQSRCIPTVNINQSELLTQQVLGFIVGNGGGANSGEPQYEFDYDEEELGMGVGEEQVVMYDAPQRFHAAGEASGNYDARDVAPAAQSPPNKDEPLKFNLFQQQHFPTNDYEADSAGVEGSGGAARPPLPLERRAPLQSVFNATQFLGAVQGLLHRPSNASNNTSYNNYNNNTSYNNYNNNNTTNNNTNSTSSSQNHTVSDLQSESSNISANFVALTTTTTTTSTTDRVSHPIAHSFAISEIDAIALPAVGAETTAATASFGGDLEPQRVSLFKDDSAVQLVTTVIVDADVAPTATTTTATATLQQPVSVSQMLRAEALLPLSNAAPTAPFTSSGTPPIESSAAATATTTTTAASASSSVLRSGTALAPQPLDAADDSINLDYLLGVADDSTTTTTMYSSLQEVSAAAGHRAVERPRSVAASAGGADTEAQELHFSTTEEPEGTTNFQLDETTVIEAQQPRAAGDGAAGLLGVVQQREEEDSKPDRLRERQHVVLKKSKVEPVGEASTTATATPTTTESAAATAMASLATPLPSAMAAAAERPAADDRFGGEAAAARAPLNVANATEQRVGADKAAPSVVGRRGGGFMSASSNKNNNNADSRNKASLVAASEINIEQELRMINELVKGKRQLAKTPTVPQTATTTTTTTTAAVIATTKTTASETTTTAAAAETAESATAQNAATTKISTGAKAAPQTAEATTKIAELAKISETTAATTTTAATVATASALSRAVANEKETITKTTTTTTTPKNAPAPTKALLESDQRVGVAVKSNTTTTTTTAITTTARAPSPPATTTTNTKTATEPNSTIWSKIMPILGFGAATTTTTITTTNVEEVPTTTLNAAAADSDTATTTTNMDAVETTTVPKAAAESSSLSSQRSHRNSKIIRVNHLDANSVGDSDVPATTTTTTTATQTPTADIDAPDEAVDDPYWWLPMGWRLDRPSTNDDQNLLMRLWSAFPESSTKARS